MPNKLSDQALSLAVQAATSSGLEFTTFSSDEAAGILLASGDLPILITSQKSKVRLAEWLQELERSRRAVYEARVALAKIQK